jgi:DNA-binding winged helix-turn-helix (wHTH) protein
MLKTAPPSASPALSMTMPKVYFGEFSAEIDESRCHGLFRGYEPVALSDVPRKVLFILLQQRPKPVVTKLLLNEIWHPGANASNLAKQVRALRVAMGDERSGRYIRTLKKEGYAFVMPVTESPRELGTSTSPVAQAQIRASAPPEPGASSGARSLGAAEWRLAREKLCKDFRGSCLHDLELLDEAIEECDHRIRLITDQTRVRLEGRFPRGRMLIPPRRSRRERGATPDAVDPESESRAAALIRHAQTTPVVVNVGSYSPACISVLQSLRQRYGLEVRADFEGLSGRQQILRLFHDDEADFLFAPHVPFLLVGDYGALHYRRLTPVHAYEQVVLRARGPARGARSKLLVYKGGYPEEQLMAKVGIPPAAQPELVFSLERLLEKVRELAPGDMVIAWEPLASGLESRHSFERLHEYRCWLSLYCHKRWQRGALGTLKNQFTQLFASEWVHCRSNREWALECLGKELDALEFFTAGTGLMPKE